ncbi:PUTATIVE PERIPLASMIC PROTEIN [Campylobacter hyointestinalis]|uniref:PUTATIVE PERIPLASMIC PROTEIN n=3 Tax=Campylobacter hyointestinalis TaxID=198 RepID=A0A9W5EP98_CAMHY|nr:SIMPL domain-containing protein [Campylobacter hyointestinalis]PPB52016.1 SIMPL domain-containing protein [Campylobacter hyointestinalis subsp. hyointestinalis]PPB53427.1 SIMPL domain-containing protein [Campylobacter hyointestinalis subsp. hyointestinalis]PPB58102.1 SIMPL domain-containing protein [Campylobacter hyointestinalis subsp. hyointestinalis]PPB61465.1 SIMPL domain-containing protein [Campylobacter hyointestinalis subsp. hyointestinalis]PPB65514.1 SIMPL domain-containing protein [
MEKNNFIAISLAIVISAIILAFGFGGIIKDERSVVVKGLAQKEVKADLAIWQMSFSLGDNDLANLKKTIEEKTKIASNFLKNQGLDSKDFSVQAPTITDNSVNPYMDTQKIRYTYIAKVNLLIRTDKIEQAKKAQSNSLDLASDGIAVSNDFDNKITFEFTKLNDIKPEMIALATKNARLAAQQFANDSGSKVGEIKKATQGLFSVENAAIGLEDIKSIRVVTQVEYQLR